MKGKRFSNKLSLMSIVSRTMWLFHFSCFHSFSRLFSCAFYTLSSLGTMYIYVYIYVPIIRNYGFTLCSRKYKIKTKQRICTLIPTILLIKVHFSSFSCGYPLTIKPHGKKKKEDRTGFLRDGKIPQPCKKQRLITFSFARDRTFCLLRENVLKMYTHRSINASQHKAAWMRLRTAEEINDLSGHSPVMHDRFPR